MTAPLTDAIRTSPTAFEEHDAGVEPSPALVAEAARLLAAAGVVRVPAYELHDGTGLRDGAGAERCWNEIDYARTLVT